MIRSGMLIWPIEINCGITIMKDGRNSEAIEVMEDLKEHARTKFQLYYLMLTDKEKKVFAEKVGYSMDTIKIHWMRPKRKPLATHYTAGRPTNGRPPNDKFYCIAWATKGVCHFVDIREHFCPDIPEKLLRISFK